MNKAKCKVIHNYTIYHDLHAEGLDRTVSGNAANPKWSPTPSAEEDPQYQLEEKCITTGKIVAADGRYVEDEHGVTYYLDNPAQDYYLWCLDEIGTGLNIYEPIKMGKSHEAHT